METVDESGFISTMFSQSNCTWKSRANLKVVHIEDHNQALTELVRQIQGRLLGADQRRGLVRFPPAPPEFSPLLASISLSKQSRQRQPSCLGGIGP